MNHATMNKNPNCKKFQSPITDEKKKKCETVVHQLASSNEGNQFAHGNNTNTIQNIVNPKIPNDTFCLVVISGISRLP